MNPSAPPPPVAPPPPGEHGALARVEDALLHVEQAIEHRVQAAEVGLARRFGSGCVRALHRALRLSFYFLLIAYFAFGTLFLLARYVLLPRADDLRPWIEREASLRLNTQVSIERIDISWRRFNPQLRLSKVQLRDPKGEVELMLPVVEAVPSWTSLPRLAPRLVSLSVLTPELHIERLGPRRFSVAGFVFEPQPRPADDGNPALDWLLDVDSIQVRDARVTYTDRTRPAAAAVEFTEVQFNYRRRIGRRQFALQARPPSALAGEVDVRGDFEQDLFERPSRISTWSGRLYAHLAYADLAAIENLAGPLAGGLRIARAQGAVRMWAGIDRLQIEDLTADLALLQVQARLDEHLPPLQLASVRARVVQRLWGNARRGGQELQLLGVSLRGEGREGRALDVPPTDLKLRWARPQRPDGSDERSELEASRLTLESLSLLAQHVPVAEELRQMAARHQARGTLTDLKAVVDGRPQQPLRYSLRTRFEGLASAAQPGQHAEAGRPQPGLPGFENLSGLLDMSDTGGTLTLASRDASLTLPGVLEDRAVPARQLSAQVRWSLQPHLQVQVDGLHFANQEVEIAGGGSWRAHPGGPGVIDLNLRLPRVNVETAVRYVPLIAGAPTRTWLRHALVAGRAVDGSLRLRGDLKEFPFIDPARGDFRIALKVHDAVLDYQSAALPTADGSPRAPWPRIDNIDADFLMDRNRMEISGVGSIYGTAIQRAVVRIPELYKRDAHLLIDGAASGPLADMVRYMVATPLNARLGQFFTPVRASGNARLDLKLDIPLSRAAEATVAGAVALSNNELVFGEALPALSRASGRVEFSQRGLGATSVTFGALGGNARLDGGTAADGTIVLNAAGTATPAGVRRLLGIAPVQSVLDQVQGSTRYSAVIGVRNGRTSLRVDSDLVGWQIGAPAPLGKEASEPMPTRFELMPAAGTPERESLQIAVGTALATTFERTRAGGEWRIERGVIGIGERAPLPASGVLVSIVLPRLDADRWRALLAPADAAASGTGAKPAASFMPDLVTARVQRLTVAGKSFAQVVLGATRQSDGGWVANLQSDQISGALSWRPQAGGGSRIVARLARLTIPDSQRDDVTELLDTTPSEVPALDVIAENFELGGKRLGRLQVVAANVDRGGTAAWQLQKLEIVNPESTMSATGQWAREPGAASRRMSLALSLDFRDGGALLARLGVPDALRASSGRIEGEMNWRGSPFSLDLATLNGHLKLDVAKGQFLKASAGAGRLLGVLSLQALPRRITLDFRDVFSEGFAFDGITATAGIGNGVLETRDFKMRGVAASVLIEGRIDVRNETQQLHVLVLPEVSAASASLAYALMANPAIGLGTFVAQMVLRDPLSRALSHEYEIAGTWNDPQVKPITAPPPTVSNTTQ